jgi:glucose-6-phosphate 1-dehydrogenase
MPADRTAPPCALVLFGASGDLTKRKLVPAAYNMALSRLLSQNAAVIGVARRPLPEFVQQMKEATAKFSRRKPLDEAVWNDLARRTSYVQGEFTDPQTYLKLGEELKRVDAELGTNGSRLFYLAVGPEQMPTIVHGLCDAGLVQPPSREKGAPFQRVVIEKPFGTDLPTARALNRDLLSRLDESQIYRIDHYLGKETVQNVIVLRFGNTIFEPLWSRQHVERVEITVAEDLGVEGRGKFYEGTGITRDIVQNHALQVLTMVAMEPPIAWDADAVRDEKVKVLRALRPIRGDEVLTQTVRGQYGAGSIKGDKVPGYRDEPDVSRTSETETFVAMRMAIDNFRWGGVPFLLRSGKRLRRRLAEVVLHFRPLPHRLFEREGGSAATTPNQLVVRIQPDEGISLRFGAKVPGGGVAIRDVAMDFLFGAAFGSSSPEAYERLLLDAMRGDATLFTRDDEVEAQWAFIDPIFEGWKTQKAPLATYDAGSWGPKEADALLPEGASWREP